MRYQKENLSEFSSSLAAGDYCASKGDEGSPEVANEFGAELMEHDTFEES
jgi:hypothetical protein